MPGHRNLPGVAGGALAASLGQRVPASHLLSYGAAASASSTWPSSSTRSATWRSGPPSVGRPVPATTQRLATQTETPQVSNVLLLSRDS